MIDRPIANKYMKDLHPDKQQRRIAGVRSFLANFKKSSFWILNSSSCFFFFFSIVMIGSTIFVVELPLT